MYATLPVAEGLSHQVLHNRAGQRVISSATISNM